MKTATLLVGFFILIGILGPAAHAQTINAASCNASDVQTALNSVNQASAAVVIPAGTCTWSSAISYTIRSGVTSLTIQGQTAVSCTGTAGTSSYSCTPTDSTVLVDQYDSANQPLMSFNVGSAFLRITGISFKGGTVASGDNKPNGFVTFGGSSGGTLRVDHCDFNDTTYSISQFGGGATIFSPIAGVWDHDVFTLSGQDNGVRDYGGSGDFGDTAWSQPTNFGNSNFMFIESSQFNGGFVNDCDFGGREVVRYNTIVPNPNNGDNNQGAVQTHQVGQGGSNDRTRGCRAIEVYHNYFYNSNPNGLDLYSAGDGGSGTGLKWGNTISSGYSFDIIFENVRETSAGHPQQAPPNGFGDCGSSSAWDGDSIAATGYPCIDQTGRGQGDLLDGQNFPNALDSVTGSISWPHNLLEPWYVWDEALSSGQVYNNPAWNGVQMIANRDFYSQAGTTANTSPTSPFNGSTGTGWGTLADRPASCTAGPGGTYGQSPTGSYGVAYWAADANSGNGELYVCTSTNTWTAVYEPYTYPHPLISGGTTESNAPNAPTPPTGLTASVQ